ncbi:hypothetical protein [Mucilaginibacter myungsuensis]|uniref:Uncharacterized protein n=1 Tax=Mucilaginibacter myungsuensis TaxID=649104 RepID=A0A929L6H0_9SPHI|nr:hypothetical protein [Mucilaginibacter myungsuensis]MBE9664081.1 hypothetical protein [Mucilaginibacter myungsuensis]MDN3601260.1 hypothetical protein [Mucilaginibacter myungsuensis]
MPTPQNESIPENDPQDQHFEIPPDHLKDILQGQEDVKNGEFLTEDEFKERYRNYLNDTAVFVIPENMKQGIREANEDIRNNDVYSMKDFEERYKKWLM